MGGIAHNNVVRRVFQRTSVYTSHVVCTVSCTSELHTKRGTQPVQTSTFSLPIRSISLSTDSVPSMTLNVRPMVWGSRADAKRTLATVSRLTLAARVLPR